MNCTLDDTLRIWGERVEPRGVVDIPERGVSLWLLSLRADSETETRTKRTHPVLKFMKTGKCSYTLTSSGVS